MRKIINSLPEIGFSRVTIKNCSYFLLLNSLFVISSCSSSLPTDPLLVPPAFDVVPDASGTQNSDVDKINIENTKEIKDKNEDAKINSKEDEKDVQELKDLLLD